MPEYIVLHYYSGINLNFTATSANTSEASSTLTPTWTATGDSVQTLAASATEVGPATMNVTLKNAWAIAGLSSAGTATVAITGTDFSATRSTSSSIIAASDYQVASSQGVGASDKAGAASITTYLRGVSGQTQTVGDVKMKLNFSNTTESGAHKGTFTITATTI